MAVQHIGYGVAIAGYVAIHSICLAYYTVHVKFAGRHRYTVYGIVGGHNRRQIIFLNKRFIRPDIKFPDVTIVHVGTACMTIEFSVVGKIMLAAWYSLQVFGIVAH